jgi:hypothetical protein
VTEEPPNQGLIVHTIRELLGELALELVDDFFWGNVHVVYLIWFEVGVSRSFGNVIAIS